MTGYKLGTVLAGDFRLLSWCASWADEAVSISNL